LLKQVEKTLFRTNLHYFEMQSEVFRGAKEIFTAAADVLPHRTQEECRELIVFPKEGQTDDFPMVLFDSARHFEIFLDWFHHVKEP
jgi:hypothetical protein